MTSLLMAPAGVLARSAPQLVRWWYHFTDLRTGILLTTLPMTGVALSDVLGGASEGSGVVPLSSASIRARNPFAATVPRRTACWAQRAVIDPRTGLQLTASVPWAGIVMKRERSLATRQLKLSMVTWPGYLQRRLVTDGFFKQADKFDIMRRLVADGWEQPDADTADPGVYGNSPHTEPMDWAHVTGAPSGVRADRTYLSTDLKPVLEAITELGNSGDGFDWRMVPYMAAPGDLTSFRVRMDLGYPRLGRVAPPDLRWSASADDARHAWGHLSDLTITEDGSGVHNRVTAVGSGTGSDQIRAAAESDEQRSGYMLYEGSLSSSTSEDRTYDTVYGKARGALLAGLASAVTLSGIKVRGDLPPTLESYAVGDDATVRTSDTTTGLTETFTGQIVGRTINPPDRGGTEDVTFDVQGTVASAAVTASSPAVVL